MYRVERWQLLERSSATWILSGVVSFTASLSSLFLFRYTKDVLRFSFLNFEQQERADRSSAVMGLSERSRSVTFGWSKVDNCDPESPLFRNTFLKGSFKLGGRMVKSSVKG